MRVFGSIMAVFVLLAACGGDAGTEANTEIFDWSRTADTTMEDVRLGADIGAPVQATEVVVFTPESRGMCAPSFGEVRVQLDLAYGEVPTDMGESNHLVPSSVKATLLSNDVWNVGGECEPQIRVPLAEPSEGGQIEVPRVLVAACQLTFQRADDSRIVALEISGDQQVQVSAGFDQAHLE